MFIFEKLVNDFNAKQEAWERACEKWVEEGKTSGGYNYRSRREYENDHPRPIDKLKLLWKGFVIVLCSAVLAFLMIGFIKEIAENQKNKPKEETVQTDKNCQAFNKDDHVRIQYGDYKGNNGTIVGGCEKDQAYQVKLDDKQYANISNDGNNEPVEVSNNLISVNDKDNLVKIEVPEEKKAE